MRDFADLMLEAQANMTRRAALLQKKITLPIFVEHFRMQWASMPDVLKEKFKREQPDQYQQLMKLIQGDNNAN